MFADEVFAPSALTTLEQLFNLRILSEKYRMKLSLKEKKKNVSLFRASENIAYEVQISRDKVFVDNTLRSRLIVLRSVIGIKLSINLYTFRRSNDEALDNSNELHNQDRFFRRT